MIKNPIKNRVLSLIRIVLVVVLKVDRRVRGRVVFDFVSKKKIMVWGEGVNGNG